MYNLKRALLAGLSKGNNWVYLAGLAAIGIFGISVLTNKESKANLAGTMNSIYPIASGTQPQDTYPHPTVLSNHRSFRDYSINDNSIPTPFVEVNFPYDAFKTRPRLANIFEKCVYIPTYTGEGFAQVY